MGPSPNPLAVSILVTGNELLRGECRDENTCFLTRCLAERRLRLREVRWVEDDVHRIAEAVASLVASGSHLVMTTGGVGPTPDDVTYAAVADALGLPLVEHPQIRALVDAWTGTEQRAAGTTVDYLRRMCRVPLGATLVAPDRVGGPVVEISQDGGCANGGTTVLMLPGDPVLLRDVMDRGVADWLPRPDDEDDHVTITHGLPESVLGRVFDALRRYPTVLAESYSGTPMRLRISGPPSHVRAAGRMVDRELHRLARSGLGT